MKSENTILCTASQKPFVSLFTQVKSICISVIAPNNEESVPLPVCKILFQPHIQNFGDDDFLAVKDKGRRPFTGFVSGMCDYPDLFFIH